MTLFTHPISTSSNLPQNAYMHSLKKWVVDSWIHAVFSVLEVIKDTAYLTEAEYNTLDGVAVYMSFSTFLQSITIHSL